MKKLIILLFLITGCSSSPTSAPSDTRPTMPGYYVQTDQSLSSHYYAFQRVTASNQINKSSFKFFKDNNSDAAAINSGVDISYNADTVGILFKSPFNEPYLYAIIGHFSSDSTFVGSTEITDTSKIVNGVWDTKAYNTTATLE